MTPTLLDELQQHGIRLALDGDRLMASPKASLTAELRAAITEHKADLIALLCKAAEDVQTCLTCGKPARRLGTYLAPDGRARYHCGMKGCLAMWRRPQEGVKG